MTSGSAQDRHHFQCDSCEKNVTVISDDFIEAWGSLKAEGWTTFKHEGDWLHECPACSN